MGGNCIKLYSRGQIDKIHLHFNTLKYSCPFQYYDILGIFLNHDTRYTIYMAGLTMLTWSSINLDSYVSQITREMSKLELLINRINDLCIYRIDAVLKDMGQTLLCELPDHTAWSVDHFLARTEIVCNTAAVQLQLKSRQVEKATNELIEIMMCYEVNKRKNMQ